MSVGVSRVVVDIAVVDDLHPGHHRADCRSHGLAVNGACFRPVRVKLTAISHSTRGVPNPRAGRRPGCDAPGFEHAARAGLGMRRTLHHARGAADLWPTTGPRPRESGSRATGPDWRRLPRPSGAPMDPAQPDAGATAGAR